MKPYTVLLLYPDYVADEFGHDTYLAHVTASDPAHADVLACEQGVAALAGYTTHSDDGSSDEDSARQLAEDFHTLALFEGHLEDLKPL